MLNIRCGAPQVGAVLLLLTMSCAREAGPERRSNEPCNGNITLPAGFCATILADSLGPLRHLAVASNGHVYAARWESKSRAGGIVMVTDVALFVSDDVGGRIWRITYSPATTRRESQQ